MQVGRRICLVRDFRSSAADSPKGFLVVGRSQLLLHLLFGCVLQEDLSLLQQFAEGDAVTYKGQRIVAQ
jgi:hypothetical protein